MEELSTEIIQRNVKLAKAIYSYDKKQFLVALMSHEDMLTHVYDQFRKSLLPTIEEYSTAITKRTCE